MSGHQCGCTGRVVTCVAVLDEWSPVLLYWMSVATSVAVLDECGSVYWISVVTSVVVLDKCGHQCGCTL